MHNSEENKVDLTVRRIVNVPDEKMSISTVSTSSIDRRSSYGEAFASNRESFESNPYEFLRRTSSLESSDRLNFRRSQNDMQVMTFRIRALDEKVEKIVKDAGMNMHSNGIYERGVAFSARLTDNSSVQSRNNLIFTDVLTNIGQAYDPESGVFKCPFYGRYLFSLKIRAPDYKQVSVEILAKSHVIATLTAGDTNVDKSTASVTVVVSLLFITVHIQLECCGIMSL
ncbi:hypothetical protein ACF0H5_004776 [Mactra antiquata]